MSHTGTNLNDKKMFVLITTLFLTDIKRQRTVTELGHDAS